MIFAAVNPVSERVNNIAGVPLARDAALVEAGLDLQLTAQAKVGVFMRANLPTPLTATR
jgi:uncharacterized protein with beta-barrel porin domain